MLKLKIMYVLNKIKKKVHLYHQKRRELISKIQIKYK